jgi:hypothetical protein
MAEKRPSSFLLHLSPGEVAERRENCAGGRAHGADAFSALPGNCHAGSGGPVLERLTFATHSLKISGGQIMRVASCSSPRQQIFLRREILKPIFKYLNSIIGEQQCAMFSPDKTPLNRIL